MQPNELDILKRASDGLDYPSESDAPFEVVLWEASVKRAQDILIEHVPKGATIKEVSINQFFEQLKDSDDVARFADLRRTLESQLSDVHVFRVSDGSAKVDIYLIGKTHTGAAWAGLHTVSIET